MALCLTENIIKSTTVNRFKNTYDQFEAKTKLSKGNPYELWLSCLFTITRVRSGQAGQATQQLSTHAHTHLSIRNGRSWFNCIWLTLVYGDVPTLNNTCTPALICTLIYLYFNAILLPEAGNCNWDVIRLWESHISRDRTRQDSWRNTHSPV